MQTEHDHHQQLLENVGNLLDEVTEATAEFHAQGFGTEARHVAVAYVIGRHRVPASYHPKVSHLHDLRLRREADARRKRGTQ